MPVYTQIIALPISDILLVQKHNFEEKRNKNNAGLTHSITIPIFALFFFFSAVS